ncbi:MAG: hypothetical protein ACK2TT_01650 [Anaerolineales bacterium]
MAAEAEVQTTAPSDLSQGEKNGDQPDYETVFPQDQVNEITITISPEDWQLMMDDMRDLFGEQGSGQKADPMQGPGQPARAILPLFPHHQSPIIYNQFRVETG